MASTKTILVSLLAATALATPIRTTRNADNKVVVMNRRVHHHEFSYPYSLQSHWGTPDDFAPSLPVARIQPGRSRVQLEKDVAIFRMKQAWANHAKASLKKAKGNLHTAWLSLTAEQRELSEARAKKAWLRVFRETVDVDHAESKVKQQQRIVKTLHGTYKKLSQAAKHAYLQLLGDQELVAIKHASYKSVEGSRVHRSRFEKS